MTSEGRRPLPCSAPKLSFQSWATVALSALLSMPTAQGAFMKVVLLPSQGRTTVPCQSPSLLLEWVSKEERRCVLWLPWLYAPAHSGLHPASGAGLSLLILLLTLSPFLECSLPFSVRCSLPILQGPGHISPQPSSLVQSPKPDVISDCDKSWYHFSICLVVRSVPRLAC